MIDAVYKKELLRAWEDTYKKGQLTFWIFLALKDSPKYVGEIRTFIENNTRGAISCEDQSLYRSLRKFYDLEMVDYSAGKGNKGPDRKYYSLTVLGAEILEEFIQRNILLLFNDDLKKLITGGEHNDYYSGD